MAGDVQTPTYFGNFVTMHMNPDELTIEVRRHIPQHKETMAATGGALSIIPPATIEDVLLKLEPVARVILTYASAKALKDFLDTTWPRIESARREGRSIV